MSMLCVCVCLCALFFNKKNNRDSIVLRISWKIHYLSDNLPESLGFPVFPAPFECSSNSFLLCFQGHTPDSGPHSQWRKFGKQWPDRCLCQLANTLVEWGGAHHHSTSPNSSKPQQSLPSHPRVLFLSPPHSAFGC